MLVKSAKVSVCSRADLIMRQRGVLEFALDSINLIPAARKPGLEVLDIETVHWAPSFMSMTARRKYR